MNGDLTISDDFGLSKKWVKELLFTIHKLLPRSIEIGNLNHEPAAVYCCNCNSFGFFISGCWATIVVHGVVPAATGTVALRTRDVSLYITEDPTEVMDCNNLGHDKKVFYGVECFLWIPPIKRQ